MAHFLCFPLALSDGKIIYHIIYHNHILHMQIDQQYLHVNYSEYINIKAYTGLFKTNDVTIQNMNFYSQSFPHLFSII